MKKIYINYKNILFIMIFFIFFQPQYFATIKSINYLWKGTQIIVCISIIFIYLLKRKISKIVWYQMILSIILLFSVYINKGGIFKVLQITLFALGFIIFCEMFFKKYKERFIFTLNFSLSTLIYINFILLIIFPNGLTQNGIDRVNFLSIDNGLINFIMPAIVISIINSFIKKNKITISSKLLIVISIITIIKVWSATALVALIIMLSSFYILRKFKYNNIFTIKNYFILYFIGVLQVLFARTNGLLNIIIEQWLKKDITFTGRDIIWEKSIYLFKESPLIGVGVRENGFLVDILGFGSYANHSHNAILEILLSGGILAFCTYIIIMFISMKNLEGIKHNSIYKILISYTFGFFMLTITEVFIRGIAFYLLILLAYYSPLIIDIYEKNI